MWVGVDILDKIYKILVDMVDLKISFPLANFSYAETFLFENKSRIGSYFFYFGNSH